MQHNTKAYLKKITFFTKQLSTSALSGDYLSAFKGSGMEFYQTRPYHIGDDVRLIDWRGSMRSDRMMVREFVQERDRVVIILADMSLSSTFTSGDAKKQQLISDLAATLTLVAHENKDQVGLLLFANEPLLWLAPKRGVSHMSRLLESLMSSYPEARGTNIASALRFLVGLRKRGAIVFLISDFIDTSESDYARLLKVVGKVYDCVAFRVLDDCERQLPDVGMLEVCDPETGFAGVLTNATDGNALLEAHYKDQGKLLASCKIDLVDLAPSRPFIHDVSSFFYKRIRRSI